ncbi:TetR/AcrR family transcriptional regulator [Chelatococcus asaccharovorans]|uniref:TetR family transcriptional regulator n=1 Tax=Chelatococcus asaccharovorans TaxID=28210 RepID=A0A2V3U560_9HYPH|nr:TetR/AcrR family transcriptional regulator [Chelatococcus asaccharovorans]MBS7703698.1 TetR/AcrR family transcriptional regulator [Chelatococcus asaccharovorans]PXW57857.1 TetR family transcriptional regulator [Chelatococcus asaccharovorans]
MPYSKEHTLNTRQRILDSAVHLFSKHGYEGVTLDDLMRGAQLTRGAFYAHFDSKRKVYVEAIFHAAVHGPVAALNEKTDETALRAMIRGYLDMAHVKQDGPICLLAFLVTDVANQEQEIREVYTRVFKDMISRVNDLQMTHDRESTLAVTALMIGGVAIARALNDERLSERVLDACYKISDQLILDGQPSG